MVPGMGLGIDLSPSASTKPSKHTGNGQALFEQDPDSNDSRLSLVPPSLHPNLTMRSSKGMEGLLLAEVGASMVELDALGGGSGFREGRHIASGTFTPVGASVKLPRLENTHRISPGHCLSRHGTLLSQDAPAARNAAELKSLLGNSRSRVKAGAAVLPPHGQLTSVVGSVSPVALEQGKSRARVEVDIVLESGIAVEGGYLNGHLRITVRQRTKKEDPICLSEGKVRVAGFEVTPDDEHRHIFYHVSSPLMDIASGCHELYTSSPDSDGFAFVREGSHILPFSLPLPVGGSGGSAKGALHHPSEATIRYIAIASIKVKESETSKRSVAHFYRNCEIWPAFDPFTVLAPSPRPIHVSCAKKLFMGGSGKLRMTAEIHRGTWVAGQRCYVKVTARNETKKTVKSLVLSLIRTTTIFRPKPHLDAAASDSDLGGDPDACQTSTTQKQVAETTLISGHRGTKGRVSAKGWWTGVEPGETISFTHFILLPEHALSVARSRIFEVEYSIRVSLSAGSLTSDACVTLPIRVVNFMSIDPPPSAPNMAQTPTQSAFSSSIDLDFDSGIDYEREHSTGSTDARIAQRRDVNGDLPRALDVMAGAFPSHERYDLGHPEDAEELDGALGEFSGSVSSLRDEHELYEGDSGFGGESDEDSSDGRDTRRGRSSNRDMREEECRLLHLANPDFERDVDSEEELDFMVGTARLEGAEWRNGGRVASQECEGDTLSGRGAAARRGIDGGKKERDRRPSGKSRSSNKSNTSSLGKNRDPGRSDTSEYRQVKAPRAASTVIPERLPNPTARTRSRSEFHMSARANVQSPPSGQTHARGPTAQDPQVVHGLPWATAPQRPSFAQRVQGKLAASRAAENGVAVRHSPARDRECPVDEAFQSDMTHRTADHVVCSRTLSSIPCAAKSITTTDVTEFELRKATRQLPRPPAATSSSWSGRPHNEMRADADVCKVSPAPAAAVSSVRAKIAMLELKAKEQVGGVASTSAARPGVSRSATTSSIPVMVSGHKAS